MPKRNGSSHLLESLASGMAGAAALTAVHEAGRKLVPDAPRMDIYARRVAARGMELAGVQPPGANAMHALTLVGDLITNGLFYALVLRGTRQGAADRSILAGALAGIGGVFLPPLLGLGRKPSNATHRTQLMTIAYYTLGGLAAATVFRAAAGKK
jgi:hypothetical protein